MADAVEHEEKQIKRIKCKLVLYNVVMMLLIVGQGVLTTLSLVFHEEVIQFNIESCFFSLI